MVRPPSTIKVAPVTKEASSDARKQTARPTSSGRPMRPRSEPRLSQSSAAPEPLVADRAAPKRKPDAPLAAAVRIDGKIAAHPADERSDTAGGFPSGPRGAHPLEGAAVNLLQRRLQNGVLAVEVVHDGACGDVRRPGDVAQSRAFETGFGDDGHRRARYQLALCRSID